VINVEDITSIPENEVIDTYEDEEKVNKIENGVSIINADVIIHQ